MTREVQNNIRRVSGAPTEILSGNDRKYQESLHTLVAISDCRASRMVVSVTSSFFCPGIQQQNPFIPSSCNICLVPESPSAFSVKIRILQDIEHESDIGCELLQSFCPIIKTIVKMLHEKRPKKIADKHKKGYNIAITSNIPGKEN